MKNEPSSQEEPTPSRKSISAAYKRLYVVRSVGMPDGRTEFAAESSFREGVCVTAYLGPRPRHAFGVFEQSSKWSTGTLTLKVKQEYLDWKEAEAEGKLFLEILAVCGMDFDGALVDAAAAKDQAAEQVVMERSWQLQATLQPYVETLAGILGLRFHNQLVLDFHEESNLVFIAGGHTLVKSYMPCIRNLETVPLPSGAAEMFETLVRDAHGFKKASRPLEWLQDAWRDDRPEVKFVMLFTALETVLNGRKAPKRVDAEAKALHEMVRKAVKKSAFEKSDKVKMLEAFSRLTDAASRPSLNNRFADLAEEAKLPGWRADIEAFDHFNRRRNGLVHRGEKEVTHILSVSEAEVRSLEDLVERYISYVTFGDAEVYSSRFRVFTTGPAASGQAKREEG